MLIDVHGHFGFSAAGPIPPARLASYAGVAGVDLLLASNRDGSSRAGAPNLDEPDANSACLHAAQAHPRLAPLYWVRPGRPDSHPTAIAGALAAEPFAGMLFAPADNDFEVAAALLEPYLAVAARVGVPAVFCVADEPRAAPQRVGELARRHAGVNFVLCHCDPADALRAASLDTVRTARQRGATNLHLDTSHGTAEWIQTAVRTLGAERVLYGSNAVSYGDAHVPRQITVLDRLKSLLGAEELAQVSGGNARRLFRLQNVTNSDT